jgi:hypothetical protein
MCYNGTMKTQTKTHPTWDKLKKLKFNAPQPRYAHLTEANAVRGGEGAFAIRVYLSSNPYSDNNLRNAWVRGYKRAERIFNDSIRRSYQIQSTIEMEEVEA